MTHTGPSGPQFLFSFREPLIAFCLYRFLCSGRFMWMESYNMWYDYNIFDWLLSLSIIYQGSSIYSMYQYLIPFYFIIIFCLVAIPHLTYLFISWWVFGLFPLFNYYDELLWYCFWFYIHDEHLYTGFCVHYIFVSFGYVTKSEIPVSYGIELPTCFPVWMNHFTFPSAMYEASSFSTISSSLCYCLSFWLQLFWWVWSCISR